MRHAWTSMKAREIMSLEVVFVVSGHGVLPNQAVW